MKYRYEVISLESLAQEGRLKEHETLAKFLCQFLNEKERSGWEFSASVSPMGWQHACLIFRRESSYAD